MTQLRMLSDEDKRAETRRLYFQTTRQTIQRDLERALEVVKARVTVPVGSGSDS